MFSVTEELWGRRLTGVERLALWIHSGFKRCVARGSNSIGAADDLDICSKNYLYMQCCLEKLGQIASTLVE